MNETPLNRPKSLFDRGRRSGALRCCLACGFPFRCRSTSGFCKANSRFLLPSEFQQYRRVLSRLGVVVQSTTALHAGRRRIVAVSCVLSQLLYSLPEEVESMKKAHFCLDSVRAPGTRRCMRLRNGQYHVQGGPPCHINAMRTQLTAVNRSREPNRPRPLRIHQRKPNNSARMFRRNCADISRQSARVYSAEPVSRRCVDARQETLQTTEILRPSSRVPNAQRWEWAAHRGCALATLRPGS